MFKLLKFIISFLLIAALIYIGAQYLASGETISEDQAQIRQAYGLLDILVSGDIDRVMAQGDYGNIDLDALKERVRERIKQIIEENKDDLRDNWRSKMDEVIQNMINELEGSAGKYTAGDNAGEEDAGGQGEGGYDEEGAETSPYSEEELAVDMDQIPKDEHGCGPGYVWRRMSGVGCVQEGCAEAGGHYSYTQECICTFVGSQPGDPTKACRRPRNYIGCPACVYACVPPETECPPR